MRTSRILFVIVALIILAVVWRLVSYGISHQPLASNVPVIGATNFPIADIVRAIGGDDVQVVQIVPPGADPHTFEPSPSTVTLLNDAETVYGMGGSYDDWIEKYLPDDTVFVSVSADIAPRVLPDGDVDPHVWLNVAYAKQIAATVTRDLSNRLPASQSTFQENYAAYAEELDGADREIRETLANVANTSIVTGHDAWYYFADAYGFTVLGTFEEDHGSEPSARHLQALAAAMRSANLTTIYADAGTQSVALQQFAADNGFTILTVDPEGTTAPRNYIHLMQENAEAFSNNK